MKNTQRHMALVEESLDNLCREYTMRRKAIIMNFLLLNNDIKEGDVITDLYHTIRVENIKYPQKYYWYGCEYVGVRLRKDGKPMANQSNNTVYQINVKSVNGKQYENGFNTLGNEE